MTARSTGEYGWGAFYRMSKWIGIGLLAVAVLIAVASLVALAFDVLG